MNLYELSSVVKIILIEDNPGDVRLIQEMLGQNGLSDIHLHVFTHGKAAWEYMEVLAIRMEEALPDLVLLDLHLPGRDGIEILHHIREYKRFQTLPVVVISSSPLDENIQQAYLNGANCYLIKPMDLPEYEHILIHCIHFFTRKR
ncbi:MAG: response regulator [Bacteroidetes bacterium]|nr:MAG: response regulator [Bacteroidota bacterium]